jgi:hypothetical protein
MMDERKLASALARLNETAPHIALAERYNRVLIEYRIASRQMQYFTARDHAMTYVGGGWYRQGGGSGSRYRGDYVREHIAQLEAATVEACQDRVRQRAEKAPYQSDVHSYKALLNIANGLPRALRVQVLAFHRSGEQ